ncbi:MAG: FAD-binding oxidoreductase [Ectothiorhodospiraceae bacterium]|nr:FAD-binding oxidoreductase [Chromatiales bacterium]MCP5156975.1 FAD-binding oxidoreductase [Ectothiorhodospiraceae bacterium]
MSEYPSTWYARNARPSGERPPLDHDVETDVCVIGGGLAGLSTAMSLVERGRDVVVLEANRVGWGASGRNGGFLGAGFALPLTRLVARVGLDQARELYRLSADGVARVRERIEGHGIDCGPVIEGSLRPSWFDDRAALERTVERMARDFGVRWEIWPRERVRAALLSPRYFDATFHPASVQIQPLDYCRGLADAVARAGGRVAEESAVTHHDLAGAEKVVRTARATVRARHVVFACGGYIGALHRRLASAIVPIATYVVATEPLGAERLASAIRVRYSISDDRFANDYYRALDDTRILWGGRISARRSEPGRLGRMMLGDLVHVYPQLAGVRADSAWSGLMSYAVHKMPQVGTTAPGVWHAMGFGGHGLNTTAMAGEMLAGAIAEGDDRYRLLAPFGLTPTGGWLGSAAAQLTYWAYELGDFLRARRNPR